MATVCLRESQFLCPSKKHSQRIAPKLFLKQRRVFCVQRRILSSIHVNRISKFETRYKNCGRVTCAVLDVEEGGHQKNNCRLACGYHYNGMGPKERNDDWRSSKSSCLVTFAMVFVQIVFAGSQILTKVALNGGACLLAILAYRHLVAAICVCPLALLDRGGVQELTNWRIWLWAFLAAFTGITMGMGLFYYGLKDTSATYATNFSNLVPIVTFGISIICGLESLNMGKRWGKLKATGTVLCVGGAMVMSLYRGNPIPFVQLYHGQVTATSGVTMHGNIARGTVLLLASCVGYAFWFIAQVKLLAVLPSKHWANLLTCLMAFIQTTLLGLFVEPASSSWRMACNVEFASILCSGTLASAAAFFLILWAIDEKGPAYPPMFDPLSVVFVAIIEALFFGEILTVGILLGMVTMIIGLYCYLWGLRDEVVSRNAVPASTTREPVGGNNSCAA